MAGDELPVGVLEPPERPIVHWWLPFDGGRDYVHIRPDGQVLITSGLTGITLDQLRPFLPYLIIDPEGAGHGR